MGPRTRSSTPKKEAAKAEQSTKSSSTKKRRTRSSSQGEKSLESLSSPLSKASRIDSPQKVNEKMVIDEVTTKTTPSQSTTPSVDLFVHRLRHLRYIPSAILCIKPNSTALSHTTKKKGSIDTYVAISRQDGQVELRSIRQKFRILATVAGWSSTAINDMVWASPRTLVGATKDGSLLVIDFQRGHFRNVTPSGGGQVHALDSFTSDRVGSGPSVVAAACEDGSVRFFEIDDQNEDHNMPLSVLSTIPSAGAPILSLSLNRFATVNKEKNTSNPLAGCTVFVGVADGTIRRYDASQGSSSQWKSVLRITVESLGRNIPTRIWALKSLQDGTLVSGDSLGHVQLWDGHSGTLEASFNQNDSKADVLSLDVTRDQNKVFASGVDSRVICIERNSETTGDRKWTLTNAQRPHTHDVQAVAICFRNRKKGSGGSEILCTGGVDTKLCTYAVNDFQRQRPHNIFYCPARSPISIASEPRILSIMRRDCIQIYSLATRPDSSLPCPILVNESDSLLGTVKIESQFNLSISTISADGKYLLIGNSANALLFQLEYDNHNGKSKSSIIPKRLSLQLPSKSPIMAAKFTRNNQLLLCNADRSVYIVTVSANGSDKVQPVASVQSKISLDDENLELPALFLPDDIVCSTDGRWFATIRSSSEKGSIQVFKEVNGTFLHWWSIPEFDVPPAAAAFLHSDSVQLVVTCSNFAPYVFDVEGRSLANWSKKVSFPVGESLPTLLHNRKDSPMRIAIDPSSPDLFLLGSYGVMVAFDMRKEFPTFCRTFPEVSAGSKKRNRSVSVASIASDTVGNEENGPNCTICSRYNGMLYMDFIDGGELVVVEQPWVDVVATLPDALHRKVYGT